MAKSRDEGLTFTIPEILRAETLVKIEGITPLLSNKFGEKERNAILDKMMGKPKTKAKKDYDPEKACWQKVYWIDQEKGVHGLPVSMFKRCTVNSTVFFEKKVSKVLFNTLWFKGQHIIDGLDLVELKFKKVWCREDVISVNSTSQNKAKGLTHRPCYEDWSCELSVKYASDLIKLDMLINLLNAAGTLVGVGNWRPERGGDFGQFKVISYE